MNIVETDKLNILVGSRWKFIRANRANVNVPHSNPIYIVNRVTDRRIMCGIHPNMSNLELTPTNFMQSAIRLNHPDLELLVQIGAIMGQLALKPKTLSALKEELIKFEI